ncbi:MAG: hypothetical protein WD096_07625 [Actinomycetota bacterium]
MDERDLIRHFFGEPGVDPAAKARARLLLGEAMQGRRRDVSRIGVAAAIVAVLVVSALVWSTSRPRSAAARALDDLAAVPYTALEPGSGEYLHQVSEEVRTEAQEVLGGGEVRAQVLLDVDQWLREDGSGEVRSVTRAVTFPSPEDERAWSESGGPPLPVAGRLVRDEFGPGEGPLVAAEDIPVDPDLLVTSLRDGSIAPYGQGDALAFALIGDLLAQGNLPGPTRTALLSAATTLDGVRLLGPDEDQLGREGESFSVRATNVETRLLFDPDTGGLLSRETYEQTPSGAWDLVGWQAYISVELVRRIPAAAS